MTIGDPDLEGNRSAGLQDGLGLEADGKVSFAFGGAEETSGEQQTSGNFHVLILVLYP